MYEVGMCVSFTGQEVAFPTNDNANGWVMLTNS
jgi:hypothetical protein